jgi:hypothetical protein
MSDIINQKYVIYYNFNSESGLYDLTMNDKSIIKSQYRIVNETGLKNNKQVGFFNISADDKYIFLDNKDADKNYSNLYKYSRYAQLNNLDNNDLFEISINPVKSIEVYNYVVPVGYCLVLAYEDDIKTKRMQIIKTNLYNQYDCISVFINQENFKDMPEFPEIEFPEIVCKKRNNNKEIDNNEVNNKKYYVYGSDLTNIILTIIMIALVYSLLKENCY